MREKEGKDRKRKENGTVRENLPPKETLVKSDKRFRCRINFAIIRLEIFRIVLVLAGGD